MMTLPGGGGADTVTDALPVLVSALALIVALPAATPVTRPACVTVATAGLELAHVTAAELAGLVVAVSWTVAPTCIEEPAGETVMVLTFVAPAPLAAEIVGPPADESLTAVGESLHPASRRAAAAVNFRAERKRIFSPVLIQ
jgi:hypothetical protein